MKKLLIIRHAHAEDPDFGQRDFDRKLTSKGREVAQKMGLWLKSEAALQPDIIVSSPAPRATETAEIIGKILDYPEKNYTFEAKIYESSVFDLLFVINHLPDTAETAFIFGHNPGLAMLADYLGDMPITSLSKCGMIYLSFEAKSWEMITKGLGKTHWIQKPKEL
jgi:phosphohistidine phosphatase